MSNASLPVATVQSNPDRRFFGRRKGKSISPSGYACLDRFDKIIFNDASLILHEAAQALSKKTYRAVILEIGFGSGDFLYDQAINHPDILFIGCELYLNGVVQFLQRLERRNPNNILIFNNDALHLLKSEIDLQFTKIYLLFPDPWTKKRHRKRRFLQNDTVALFANRLTEGGAFHFATDVKDYAEWGLIKLNQIENLALSSHPIHTPFYERVVTKYQSKSFDKQHDRYFLIYHKISDNCPGTNLLP